MVIISIHNTYDVLHKIAPYVRTYMYYYSLRSISVKGEGEARSLGTGSGSGSAVILTPFRQFPPLPSSFFLLPSFVFRFPVFASMSYTLTRPDMCFFFMSYSTSLHCKTSQQLDLQRARGSKVREAEVSKRIDRK